jgi:hypothetical protein
VPILLIGSTAVAVTGASYLYILTFSGHSHKLLALEFKSGDVLIVQDISWGSHPV